MTGEDGGPDPIGGPFPPPEKHSLTLSGHRTSVSLERPFWIAFQNLAARRRVSVNTLAARIDRARGTGTTLASAIRLFVLESLRER